MFARHYSKVQRSVFSELVITANRGFNEGCANIEIPVACAGEFEAQRQLGLHLLDERATAGEHSAARSKAFCSRCLVTGKQYPAVQPERRILRKGLLQNAIHVKVSQTGTYSIVLIASGKLKISLNRHGRQVRVLAFLQKVVLHRKVCIAQSGGPEGLGAAGVENCEQRSAYANLNAIQQSVFEFEHGRVLFGAGKRGALQQIEFIGEAEMEVTFGGRVYIVCDERLLSGGGDRNYDQQGQC